MGLDGERKVAQLVHDGRGLRGLTRKIIQGALHTTSPQFTDMRVDHGRRHIGVAQEVLDGSDILARFQ